MKHFTTKASELSKKVISIIEIATESGDNELSSILKELQAKEKENLILV